MACIGGQASHHVHRVNHSSCPWELVAEQADGAVSSCTEHPGLGRVEGAVKDALQFVDCLVAVQDLHGNNQGVGHQVLHGKAQGC